MEPSCFQSEASGGVIWHYRVVEVPCEGSRKQRRKKGIERDRARRAAGTAAGAKEHKLGKPRTKDRATRAARVASSTYRCNAFC